MSLWLDAALSYAKLGWRMVPLHERDKRPHPKAWQKAATTDAEILEQWAEQWPSANLGVVLGKDSGIIDVECDSIEAEAALIALAGGAENLPVTPTYKSTRGKHRLFKWSADLPCQDKAVFKLGMLEFRTGNGDLGAQSALPPSIHPTGAIYEWLVHPDEADPAELPAEMVARICVAVSEGTPFLDVATAAGRKGKTVDEWKKITGGVVEGGTADTPGRNAAAASMAGKMIGGLADPYDKSQLTVQWELLQTWNQSNKPPLDFKELKTTWESILIRHQQKWTQQQAEKQTKLAQRAMQSGEEPPETTEEHPELKGWRLEKIRSKPVKFRLYSPWWKHRAPGGFLELTTSELNSPRDIKHRASEFGVFVALWFSVWWGGGKKNEDPPMLQLLLENLREIECSPDEHRELVLAAMLQEQLHNVREADIPDQKGAPRRLNEDGSIWFKLRWISGQMQFGPDAPTSAELNELLKAIGAEDRQYMHKDTSNTRFKRLSVTAQQELQKRATYGAEQTRPTLKFAVPEREPGDEDDGLFEGSGAA